MKHAVLIALAAAAVLGACAKTEAPKSAGADVVAVVNGHEITRPVLDAYVHARAGRSFKELGATEQARVLDDMMDMVMVANAPRTTGAAAKSELDAQVELYRLQLNAQQKVNEVLKNEPSEAELKAEYDAQVKLMAGEQEYLARHILVDSREKAEALIKQLKAGADFATLARKNSSDSTASKGGELEWFGPGQMVKPFEDAVRTLKKGEFTTTPVQSQFGWHVIRLDDTRPMTPPDYEGAKERIKQVMQQKQLRSLIEELKKTAKMEKRI
jgi:peptidyl-prolyl cis-trans isomerase C